mgnify:CR=1 FL=1
MSEDLEQEIKKIYKQKGGRLSDNLKTEFQLLCQDDFRYRPDMTCGQCIYKHVKKLYKKYFI